MGQNLACVGVLIDLMKRISERQVVEDCPFERI